MARVAAQNLQHKRRKLDTGEHEIKLVPAVLEDFVRELVDSLWSVI
jgi:hypothetical protein